jgi:hypothetical protein
MDLRRLRAGEWIAGTAGLVLLLSLFMPWYEVGGADVSAFEAFAIHDVLLAGLGVAGIALGLVTAYQQSPAVTIALDALVTLFAIAISLLLVIRVLNMPGDLDAAGAERAVFAWVGVAATFGVLGGGMVAMRDERLSKPGQWTDATGVPIDAPPEIEVISSP